MRQKKVMDVPELSQLEAELKRMQNRSYFFSVCYKILGVILITAAAALLVTMTQLPFFRISGSSMDPTLHNDDIVVAWKGAAIAPGDIVAFYYGHEILVKRCVAVSGQVVDIGVNGDFYVDRERIVEPYANKDGTKRGNLTLPYTVPEEQYFCVGDNRAVSMDSRNESIGSIPKEKMIGKVVFRISPLSKFGILK